jgi:hypothetical protein
MTPINKREMKNKMKHLMVALTLVTLATPVNATENLATLRNDANLNVGAQIILYYANCTDKPLTPAAIHHLARVVRRSGETALKAEIDTLMMEWIKPGLPKCVEARSYWGGGLLPKEEQ